MNCHSNPQPEKIEFVCSGCPVGIPETHKQDLESLAKESDCLGPEIKVTIGECGLLAVKLCANSAIERFLQNQE